MQKIIKKLTRSIALAMSIVMISVTTIYASPMKDVSSSHWAYNDIVEMQKRGLLVTNSQGEFFPNQYVTYFELSQILAKATGYEDEAINPDMDPTLKKEIRDNYQKQEPFIEANAKNYKYWQHDANQEIAYLLGRGYLTREDLGKFMSKSTSGDESKRGVRKQEATAFLVRILHKAETAKKEYITTGFVDEGQIDASYRPYVAYMKNLGIVSGDQSGKFGPSQPITRATLSKMLINTLNIKESSKEEPPVDNHKPEDRALEGKITRMISKGDDSYYIVIEVEPGQTQNYTIKPSASILDKSGNVVSLSNFKGKVDLKGDSDIIVTAKVELIGNTEYITNVKIISEPNNQVPDQDLDEDSDKDLDEDREAEDRPKPEDTNKFTGSLEARVYSVLIAPVSEITVEANKERSKFKIDHDTRIYSYIDRKDISPWDLRLNQEIELKVVNNKVEYIEVVRQAPPVTLNGRIRKASVSGDQIEVDVSYNSFNGQDNKTRTINVPMKTRIIEGDRERGRKDLEEGMEVIVIYDKYEDRVPEKIIILS